MFRHYLHAITTDSATSILTSHHCSSCTSCFCVCELFNCFYKHGCCSGRDASDSNEGAETCGECSCCFGRSLSLVHTGGLNCDVPIRRAFSNPSLNLVSHKCTHTLRCDPIQGSFSWNGSSAHSKLELVSAPLAEGDQQSQVHAASALERRGGRRLQGPHH